MTEKEKIVPGALGGWEVFLTEKEKIVVPGTVFRAGGWEGMTLTFNIF